MTESFSRRGFVGLWALTVLGFSLRPARAEVPPLRLLAFGDSLIHGYGLPAEETLPAQLERALQQEGYKVEVINGGNSGDTTASGLARLEWTLGDGVDAVLVSLGANDGPLRGLPPEETERNLRAILEILSERGLPVLLAGMLAPQNLGKDYAAEFDAIFPRLAEEYGTLFYPFLLEGVVLDPALNQGDGIHPNAEGVAIIVEGLLPQTEALLDLARAHAAEG